MYCLSHWASTAVLFIMDPLTVLQNHYFYWHTAVYTLNGLGMTIYSVTINMAILMICYDRNVYNNCCDSVLCNSNCYIFFWNNAHRLMCYKMKDAELLKCSSVYSCKAYVTNSHHGVFGIVKSKWSIYCWLFRLILYKPLI